MEFDAYRDWKVRDVNWCKWCGSREENGDGAQLCAVCQGEIVNALERGLDG